MDNVFKTLTRMQKLVASFLCNDVSQSYQWPFLLTRLKLISSDMRISVSFLNNFISTISEPQGTYSNKKKKIHVMSPLKNIYCLPIVQMNYLINSSYIYSFNRRFYPKRLTNENNRSSKTNSRTTICKCYNPS